MASQCTEMRRTCWNGELPMAGQCTEMRRTCWNGVLPMASQCRPIVGQDVLDGRLWQCQGPVGTQREAAGPRRDTLGKGTLKVVGWLVIRGRALQDTLGPLATKAAALHVPIHAVTVLHTTCPAPNVGAAIWVLVLALQGWHSGYFYGSSVLRDSTL
jgi:hypothetical protein